MARVTSIRDSVAWREADAIFVNNGSVVPQSVINAYCYHSGEWRQVFPNFGGSTSFFLSPDPIGSQAKAGITGNISAAYVHHLGSLSVGAKAKSNVVRTSDPAFIIGFPVFQVYNPMTFNGQAFYEWDIGAGVVINITIVEDGRWVVNGSEHGLLASGSWGVPTTTDVGQNFWVRFLMNSLSATPQTGTTGTTGWQQNIFGVTVSANAAASGFQNVAVNYTCQIATDAAGANIVAQGTFVIRAEHLSQLLTNATFHGQTYSKTENNNGVNALVGLTLMPDGQVSVDSQGGNMAVGAWLNPATPGANPLPGGRYQVRFTLTGVTADAGCSYSPSTGWQSLGVSRLIYVLAPPYADRSVSATYTVEIWDGASALQTNTVTLHAIYDHPYSGDVVAPGGSLYGATSIPTLAVAFFSTYRDGSIIVTGPPGGTVETVGDYWFIPLALPVPTIGDYYWIRATLVSGIAPNLGQEIFNVWAPLNTPRSVGYFNIGGFVSCRVRFQIAGDAGGTSILSTNEMDIICQMS